MNQHQELESWPQHLDASSGLDGQHHSIKITTPTGHTYPSRAP